ncbi:ABC transporter substrate-binding protein [Actinotalea fermentans]|uniref:Sugar ABC transporter substrate-binding protein n=1 Tax=Actinotalea fermentans TaxID=43671 RepID=A0A511YZ06_9CELL|nr:ABC transporter substrate-binding protein [Actinotalea fermentans]KGM15878.1 sugar ABC transporter substrate-binding protein [Actinotalea fermentans ATCC 43279 = JCM 9966 = DSM 3133]GEN80414.1 sugar ABC transporter substrate-binding protein [Actinotalea fermentans]
MFRTKTWAAGVALTAGLALALAGCSGDDGGDDTDTGTDTGTDAGTDDGGDSGELISVGFVAVGPEGGWRAANEKNIQDTFTEEAGFDLSYAPATNLDQASQIAAFTSFVDEGVDVILLSATEGSGWEDSLTRAQEAEIPVILIDRGIEPDDPSLYVTRIAPDNFVVAQGVAEWALSALPEGGNYFTLEGPAGVGVVNERNRGWDDVMGDHPEFVKVGAQTANWSTEEAKSVFETVLRANNNDIQIVFAQNDEMGLGAALAVEEAGLTPGEDVKIATIDGTKPALEALAAGRLSFVAEYNPLFGQTALEVVNTVLEGGTVDSYIIVPSGTFDSPEAAEEALPSREY